ncbi:MAG: CPBP family intramembrane metalloprotease [Planctomycetes bacterium]|nr:CPBP family intramembrane metalloprotease [Planctomycetota bacterium]
MTAPRRAQAGPWLQLLAVVACTFALAGYDLRLAAVALVGFVAVWPPAVAWRPVAALAVLRVYLPFALLWFVAVTGYLQALRAIGHAVAPQPMLQELAAHGFAAPEVWPTILGIVVVGPLAEEVLFRGYLFTALVTTLPAWVAHGATAVLFGLAHGLDYALPIAVLALLFGWLRARHRALWPPVLAHMVHNGLTVSVVLLWPEILDALYPR